MSATVMFPNFAQPQILRTRPSDYTSCNQITYFVIFNIRLLLEREKTTKTFTFAFHC